MNSHPKRLVRIYSPFNPYPPTEGSPRVIVSQVEGIRAGGAETELVTWLDRSEAEPPWQKLGRVARSWVSGAASPELYYYPPSLAPPVGSKRADLGIYNYSFAHAWLKAPGARAREGRIAVHFHNLESELFEQRARFSKGVIRRLHALNASRLRAHEHELAQLTDEQWFVSRVDMDHYKSQVPEARCRWVGPGFSAEEGGRRRQDFLAAWEVGKRETQPVLALLGRYDFGPNRASLEWVVDKLAPCLRARGFAGKVQVIGNGVPDEIRRRAERFGFFEFLGFVEDLEAYWPRWSWALVPHVSGSGVRIKLLEAIASGLPVLANAEALDPVSPDLASLAQVIPLSRPDDWCAAVLSSAPGEERARRSRAPYPDSLDPKRIYGFVEGFCAR